MDRFGTPRNIQELLAVLFCDPVDSCGIKFPNQRGARESQAFDHDGVSRVLTV